MPEKKQQIRLCRYTDAKLGTSYYWGYIAGKGGLVGDKRSVIEILKTTYPGDYEIVDVAEEKRKAAATNKPAESPPAGK